MFQDEARFGQQGTLTKVWAECGSRPRMVKQTEYEWVYMYGAVNPITGESVGMLAPYVNTEWMNHHLRLIGEQVGKHRHAVLVLDQAGWHMAKALKVPDNITLLPLPPYSPELNPIERLWQWIKTHDMSNRIFSGYDHLLDAGCEAWNRLAQSRIQSVCRTSWLKRAF